MPPRLPFFHTKRFVWILILPLFFLGILWIAIHQFKRQGYGISYQISESLPSGFYLIRPLKDPLKKGDLVVFNPSPSLEHFLVNRHWLTPGVWLMKPIAAVPGDFVCLTSPSEKAEKVWWINQSSVNFASVVALKFDRKNHPLPTLSFCRSLKKGEYFLISTYSPYSFDSRYFGPVSLSNISGKATALRNL